MGCFSITCGMSRLPISDMDDVVFFPLYEGDYSALGELHTSPTIITNEGSMALYSLFSLPIFGQYNDQGGLYNIEMDDNANIVESYLKSYNFNSIQMFIDAICDEGEKCDTRGYNITGMFVLREVYDNIIKNVVTSYGKPITHEAQSANFDKLVVECKKNTEKYVYETYIRGDGFSFGGLADGLFSYELYYEHISNPYIKERFVDFMLFNQMMYYTNSIYMPQMCGSQCGHYGALHQLSKISLEIVTRNLKK